MTQLCTILVMYKPTAAHYFSGQGYVLTSARTHTHTHTHTQTHQFKKNVTKSDLKFNTDCTIVNKHSTIHLKQKIDIEYPDPTFP
jgi:hypothetical protein